jgi:hypothetical protein
MRDLASNIAPVVSVTPAAALTATPTTTAANLQGYNSCVAVVTHGAGGITFTGTNKVDFTAEHSDDNSTFTACTINDVIAAGVTSITSGIVRSWQAAVTAGSFEIGYVGSKQYFRLRPVFGGTHATGTFITVTNILGNPIVAPV